MAYGVTPTGFARKRLPDILAEIEEAARGVFGQGVVQTAQSPLGQLNGLMASIAATAWEIAEATYQSYDPDQAEGARLEQLGRIRLIERMTGELDPDLRQAITNADRARLDIADIARAASSVSGVSYVQVFENKSGSTNLDGLPAHSVAVAVIGGDDAAVAAGIRPYVVPGIDMWGNTWVNVEIDGYCRSIALIRPVAIPLGLQLSVRVSPDALGCPPPAASAIAAAAAARLAGSARPRNGADITLHLIRTAVSTAFPNVEVVGATVTELPDGDPVALPYVVRLFEIAEFDVANVSVAVL